VSEEETEEFLNSIMAAIGIHHTDFMILHVEGSELPVLEKSDWIRLAEVDQLEEYNQERC